VCFASRSEPNWQISCIRLSSRWLTFKIGKPQRALVLRKKASCGGVVFHEFAADILQTQRDFVRLPD